MYSRQCIPVSWTKAKAIPVKLFMISTGFPDRNALTLSISLYIYIDFQWRRKRKKERERIGIEQFGNARHDRGGVPMRVSRLFSNDSIPTRFLPPKSGKLSMGGYRADRKRGRIEEGLETDWPPSSRPLESSFPFDSTFFFLGETQPSIYETLPVRILFTSCAFTRVERLYRAPST